MTSLFSQLGGGLIVEEEKNQEQTATGKAGFDIRLPMLQAGLGGSLSELAGRVQRTRLHHDILERVERELEDRHHIAEIDEKSFSSSSDKGDSLYDELSHKGFVRISGQFSFESYKQMREMIRDLPELYEFIMRCGIENNPEFLLAKEQVEQLEQEAERASSHEKKAKLREAKNERKKLDEIVKNSGNELIAEWLRTGISRFIEVFHPNLIAVRVFPWPDAPEAHVIGRLSPEHLVDGDYSNLIFSYGQTPTVTLTLLGSVASVPPPDGMDFDPLSEETLDALEERYAELGDTESASFETQFRRLGSAIRNFEKFVRLSRYPNVTVIPLAIYRRLGQ